MSASRRQPGAAGRTPPGKTGLELVIGDEVVRIRIEADGIHFHHPGRRQVEGILPWDIAMAMSLVPEERRRATGPPGG